MISVVNTLGTLVELNQQIALLVTDDTRTKKWDEIYTNGSYCYALPIHPEHPLYDRFKHLVVGLPTLYIDDTWVVVPNELYTLKRLFIVTTYTEQVNTRYVRAYVVGKGNVYIWQGDEYDAIGQWTDLDVQIRLNELYPEG